MLMLMEHFKKILLLVVIVSFILSGSSAVQQSTPLMNQTNKADQVTLTVLEIKERYAQAQVSAIPSSDNSMTNPDFGLLPWHWSTTASYWINPSNKYGLSASTVTNDIKACANTWDTKTGAAVFSFKGTTSKSAGKYDGYNVIAWGAYSGNAIAVTYIWSNSTKTVETDTMLNTLYKWSLSSGAGKMVVQDIMTHEFGHWAGLNDLYSDTDYWMTMYGYANYGETYKQTLGLGDIKGLQTWYGP
jgi:hypothetical protein